MREIHGFRHTFATLLRITPACAGNTLCSYNNVFSLKDHPRMCGKYNLFNIFPFVVAGSPPHVREIHTISDQITTRQRITPACAGNTFQQNHFQPLLVGSPPHVREIPVHGATPCKPIRITPACAGNTLSGFFLSKWC